MLTPHTRGVFGQLIVGEQNMDRTTPTDICEEQIGLRIRSSSVIMNGISRIPYYLSTKGTSWCPPNIKAGLRHCASPKVGSSSVTAATGLGHKSLWQVSSSTLFFHTFYKRIL